ncbi:---NA---, partial [Paramuricea clavata]
RKVTGDVRKIEVPVQKEYINFVLGKRHRNIERIETKSGTKIKVPFRRNAEAEGRDTIRLEITGPPKNCDRAHWLIRHCVIAYKDKIANKDIRSGFGGYSQFICFDFKDENEKFELKLPDGSAPKLDGFIQGQRYRIKNETDDDSQ